MPGLYSPAAEGLTQPSPQPSRQPDQPTSTPPPSPPSNGETGLVSFPSYMGMKLIVHVDPHHYHCKVIMWTLSVN